ncbi:MAG TPA: exodeoxyribonuclease III [Nevskiaceae bacterium]|nr:exodeoxyribonuclease III [Nevskiaceae bacterium]
MLVASWNVDGLSQRLPLVLDWCRHVRPDVLALQETQVADLAFPGAAFAALGYHCASAGRGSRNGVAILARQAPNDLVVGTSGRPDTRDRVLAVTIADIRFVNVYVVNGGCRGKEEYRRKLAWLRALTPWLRGQLQRYPKLIVLGDFNITPTDIDVYDAALWRHQVLCSPPERCALQALMALGLDDSFRAFETAEGHYSWWGYGPDIYGVDVFSQNLGMRIDLILASEVLRPRLCAAYIDRGARAQDGHSDHAPVLLELADTATVGRCAR